MRWFCCKTTVTEGNQTLEFTRTFRLDQVQAIDARTFQDDRRQVHLVGGAAFFVAAEDAERLETELRNYSGTAAAH